jgi:hypothetical protein
MLDYRLNILLFLLSAVLPLDIFPRPVKEVLVSV